MEVWSISEGGFGQKNEQAKIAVKSGLKMEGIARGYGEVERYGTLTSGIQ